eukprot:TRINITY_DN13255_c0_g1_i1.p1 TRINITY_DN13255_c0_g1~~TRINITY_DN13255_c0_g1_i1.p1  ORF type:complete len:198 (+),score=28.02 TRINITY_DN13255_c0_g1_i1:101-694(+)
MGYDYQHEFIREGIAYTHYRQIQTDTNIARITLTITITQIKKVTTGDRASLMEHAIPIDPSWLVEITGLAEDEFEVQNLVDVIPPFAAHLSPLVELVPYDYRKLHPVVLTEEKPVVGTKRKAGTATRKAKGTGTKKSRTRKSGEGRKGGEGRGTRTKKNKTRHFKSKKRCLNYIIARITQVWSFNIIFHIRSTQKGS